MAGIIDLRVVEADGAGDLARVQVGRERLRLFGVEALGPGHRAAVTADAAQRVVEAHSRRNVGPLPLATDREEEGNGPDQVGCQPVEQEPALRQCLVDQRELPLLEVAQTAVGESRRSGRGAGCQVTLLHERHTQTACRGIERGSTAHDAAADDGDVYFVVADVLDGAFPRCGAEAIIRFDHFTILPPIRTLVVPGMCQHSPSVRQRARFEPDWCSLPHTREVTAGQE